METTDTAPVSAEVAPVEAAVQEQEAAPKIDFSHKFAALAKKEKALFEQRKAMEAELAELNEWKAAREQAKKNPNKLLQAHGLDFETIAKYNLEGGEERVPSEIETIKEKLERIEKENEAHRLALEEKEKEQLEKHYQAQIEGFKKQIEDHVKGAAEKYEFIGANPVHLNDVFELIEIHYQQTQKILDIDKACQLVEEHIENEFKSKYANVSKLKGLFSPQEVADTKQQAYVPTQQQDIRNHGNRPTTLTNKIVPEASYGTPIEKLSFEERRKQAASMLRFK